MAKSLAKATAETSELAAIMSTDVAGFSDQRGTDDARTSRQLEMHSDLIQPAVGGLLRSGTDGS